MTARLNYIQQAPDLFKKFVDFNMVLKQGSIEESIADLIAIRASQMNGCGFCVDMHNKQANFAFTTWPFGVSRRCFRRVSGPRWRGPKC